MIRLFPLFALLFLTLQPAEAKPDKKEKKRVLNVVEQLFNGMRSADSTLVKPLFHPDAVLGSIVKNKEGETIFRKETSPRGFISAVGMPHPEVWDERIKNPRIFIDGDMATVWAPYSFYRGTTFSHCGVNTFTLCRVRGNWLIVSIIDTRRKDRCAD